MEEETQTQAVSRCCLAVLGSEYTWSLTPSEASTQQPLPLAAFLSPPGVLLPARPLLRLVPTDDTSAPCEAQR